MDEQNKNNYERFLNKTIRIILTFASGQTISYQGQLLNTDDDSLFINDRREGHMIITKKDISQVLEVRP